MTKPLSPVPRCLAVAMLMFVASVVSVSTALAQVKPGQMVTADNAQSVKDLLSPGVFFKVQHGMSMKIVEPERIDLPTPYKAATEKYSSQARLSPDHRTLVAYVAGQPFPWIDANGSDVAVKRMWN